MHSIVKVLLGILLSLGFVSVRAQTYFTSTEIGISGGGSQYFGDLNDRYGFKTINPAYGLYARKHLNQYISLRMGAYYTKVNYSDKLNLDLYQRQRNLDFTSDIIEASFQAEFNFFRFVTGDPYHRFTPFLTMGLGGFLYDPYTTYNGNQYYLRPLGTEGQNAGYDDRKYTNFSPCVPIGVGAKFWVVGGINLTLEVVDRLTFTDYLDDVSSTYVGIDKFSLKPKDPSRALQDRSVELNPNNALGRTGKQRGNSATRDQYLMCLFSVSWHFTTYRCPNYMDKELISTY
ncbi:MAG: hypothetical protein IAE95_01895 [Chitinophagaceae bacterium]|nr:hypothetical protein [Chitinophagaceae bacterium]